ncbi:potassium transporter TrkG [Tropicimonas isoalkanivorans]|uniref:Trk system potassium uptake protein TrkH n=1 Tax=Tropicimonas isoalkanivorans TaxID=441112 RepID=A0A1I1DUP7_9RHOB|nr:potassium transporter TrkG [Tropicimonas isoalkanivorans]SFB76758.1 trk system potassium uptake protein TrkH [Tropicimonas isoalkanivorans]
MNRLFDLPLIVLFMGVGSLAMVVPALHGLAIGDLRTAHVFGQSAMLFLFISAIIAVAMANRANSGHVRSHLAGLVAAYTLVPLILAVPFHERIPSTTYMNAWVEMVSSITTTGATLFEPDRLVPSLHLWRALVGWLGGLLAWVSAFALMAPMNLGGFEVIYSGTSAGSGARLTRRPAGLVACDPRERLWRFTLTLLPIYAGLTLALWLGLLAVGEEALTAACHAMSTLATSGISPVGGVEHAQSGLAGEFLIFLFFAFAISRLTFTGALTQKGARNLAQDPEVRIGAVLVILVPSFLFLRHWIGAYEVDTVAALPSALNVLWGSTFSVLSFLSTAGFVSSEWEVARAWSGLQTPGLVLLGLALIGGGVATTAGGVKLLRVFALYKHSEREMERLIYPSSIGGAGTAGRNIRRQGAYVAWIFFMLFALSLTGVAMALAAAGAAFDEAMVMAVAALSTTGPAGHVVLDHPVSYAALNDPGKVVLAFAMALGRLETLAILALLNPHFWRR